LAGIIILTFMPAAKALMGRLLLAAKAAMDLRKVSRRIEVSCG
jgi:hypothetical protein